MEPKMKIRLWIAIEEYSSARATEAFNLNSQFYNQTAAENLRKASEIKRANVNAILEEL